MQYSVVHSSAVQYSVVQLKVVHCSAMQWSTI